MLPVHFLLVFSSSAFSSSSTFSVLLLPPLFLFVCYPPLADTPHLPSPGIPLIYCMFSRYAPHNLSPGTCSPLSPDKIQILCLHVCSPSPFSRYALIPFLRICSPSPIPRYAPHSLSPGMFSIPCRPVYSPSPFPRYVSFPSYFSRYVPQSRSPGKQSVTLIQTCSPKVYGPQPLTAGILPRPLSPDVLPVPSLQIRLHPLSPDMDVPPPRSQICSPPSLSRYAPSHPSIPSKYAPCSLALGIFLIPLLKYLSTSILTLFSGHVHTYLQVLYFPTLLSNCTLLLYSQYSATLFQVPFRSVS
jgi:hypothetical protein